MEVMMRRTASLLPCPRFPRSLIPALLLLVLPLLALTACGSGGDIQPGVGAAGVRLGDDRAAVEKTLGQPEQVSSTTVHGAKEKEVIYLLYPAKGLDVLLEDGKVRSVFLYHEGADDHRQYPGKMAGGLTLASTRDEVLKALGEPASRGLGEDANRWFKYDTGVEFTFDPTGTIQHIVITRGL
jgi:hypothetical protein